MFARLWRMILVVLFLVFGISIGAENADWRPDAREKAALLWLDQSKRQIDQEEKELMDRAKRLRAAQKAWGEDVALILSEVATRLALNPEQRERLGFNAETGKYELVAPVGSR